MSAAGEWCLIESDPSVFTELIKGFGATGLQVHELYSLDDESLLTMRRAGPPGTVLDSAPMLPVHGLIFLFRWHKEEKPAGTLVSDNRLEKMFFASQVITNACATQALLSVLLNTAHEDVHLGEKLSDFKELTASFDPTMKGLSLSNMEFIRQIHNSFARQTLMEFDPTSHQKEEEPFHFVAYVPIDGRIYELDGLKEGPLDLGKITGGDWMQDVRPILQKRMESFMGNEIRFNLMSISSDRSKYVLERMERLGTLEPTLADDTKVAQLQHELEECSRVLDSEETLKHHHKAECIRHTHNYMPMIMEILKVLARKGELGPMVDEAKERLSKKRKSEAQKPGS